MQSNPELAMQLLQSLFEGSAPRRNQRDRAKDDWTCHRCGCSNWSSRQACRKCAVRVEDKAAVAKTAAQTHTAAGKPAALAPWATPEMKQARANQLAAAIQAAQESGGCEAEVAKLEEKYKAQQKAAEKAASAGPSLRSIESTRAFISRQERRMAAMTEEIAKLQAQQLEISQSVEEAKERMRRMEAEVRGDPAPPGNSADLEEAVRLLMVTLHTHQQLPPAIAEAADAVMRKLPTPNPSEDVEDMPVDGVRIPEDAVPAASLDAAMPPAAQNTTDKRMWAETLSEIGGIEASSDADLLSWAKRVKMSLAMSPA